MPRASAASVCAESQVGLTASWEIDFWGKFRRAIESADANLLASIANYDSTLVSLTGSVANFYITIRTVERRLNIARQQCGNPAGKFEDRPGPL